MSDEVLRALGRLEGKVDALQERVGEGLDEMKAHGERIVSLEHSRAHAKGVVGAIATLSGMAGAGITLAAKKMGIA